MKRVFVVAVALTCAGYAADARAACFPKDASQRPAAGLPRLMQDTGASPIAGSSVPGSYDSIVGLW
jgi:hypothetical protein